MKLDTRVSDIEQNFMSMKYYIRKQRKQEVYVSHVFNREKNFKLLNQLLVISVEMRLLQLSILFNDTPSDLIVHWLGWIQMI